MKPAFPDARRLSDLFSVIRQPEKDEAAQVIAEFEPWDGDPHGRGPCRLNGSLRVNTTYYHVVPTDEVVEYVRTQMVHPSGDRVDFMLILCRDGSWRVYAQNNQIIGSRCLAEFLPGDPFVQEVRP